MFHYCYLFAALMQSRKKKKTFEATQGEIQTAQEAEETL